MSWTAIRRRLQRWWPGPSPPQRKELPSSGTPLRPRPAPAPPPSGPAGSDQQLLPLLKLLREKLGNSEDVLTREIRLGQQRLGLIFIDGLVDRDSIQNRIIQPLERGPGSTGLPANQEQGPLSPPFSARQVYERLIAIADVRVSADPAEMIQAILEGATVMASDSWPEAVIASTEGWEKRDISEPDIEAVVRGPREGFTENLRTNTALLRRRLRTPKLTFARMRIGTVSNTNITIAWIRGLVNVEVLKEVHQRLARIEMEAVFESGYLEEWLEDHPWSPFPQILHTERPDRVAGALLEGHVAILVDNTPMVLIVPATITVLLQSSADYYDRSWISVPVRAIRLLGLLVTLLVPAIYVALTSFQVELIPTPLMLSIAAQREQVPYPAVIEALIMGVVLQILIEAGVRLPRPVGSAITIVGAIAIGQAAVSAGLVSAAMVIAGSLTALASFAIPDYSLGATVRWLALAMLLPAATLGITGILLAGIALLIHLVSLRSFGVPYLAPTAPIYWGGQEDVIWRAPWWKHAKRPPYQVKQDVRRVGRGRRSSTWSPPQHPPARSSLRLELEQQRQPRQPGRQPPAEPGGSGEDHEPAR
ncbi:MAG TPA: spore germination protein [Firmicutes bacterium]|nr:spore germination protein [Bacillota bacterium]